MKVLIKKVYYCDHCKKRTLSAASMRKHEGHCTANPLRHCRLCDRGNISELIEAYKARFELIPNNPPDGATYDLPASAFYEFTVRWKGDPITLQEIRNETGDCVNCIFAVIRQVGLNKHYFEFEEFEYRKELEAEMKERSKWCDRDYY